MRHTVTDFIVSIVTIYSRSLDYEAFNFINLWHCADWHFTDVRVDLCVAESRRVAAVGWLAASGHIDQPPSRRP